MIGTCIFFDKLKGIGFLTPGPHDKDVFVFFKDILDPHRFLDKGEKVTFDLGLDNKGRRAARNVRRLTVDRVLAGDFESQANGDGQVVESLITWTDPGDTVVPGDATVTATEVTCE